MSFVLKCCSCKKELPNSDFSLKDVYKGYSIEGMRRVFCDEDCYNNYWNQYMVEEYNGNKIYKITRDGITGYIPYIGCSYYFITLEDCKSRMDLKNTACIDMGVFHTMNNEMFGGK